MTAVVMGRTSGLGKALSLSLARSGANGADVIKVFPASAMGGASYLKSLKVPLPHIKLIPTGGVSLANAAEFFAAGAVAVGVGADLVDEKAIVEGRRNAVVETARRYAQIAREFRS